MIGRALFVLLLAITAATPAAAKLSPNDIARAGTRPSPDARMPGDTMWTDQRGAHVRLGDLVAGKPTVLLFADYTCRHICGPGLTLTAGALADGDMRVGEDVAFVILGLDPKDGPAEARAMAKRRLDSLPEIVRNVELLSADAKTIAKAESALGFTAVYDPSTDQYAHDASAYIFNADGRLTKLLPETALVPSLLEKALKSSGGSAGGNQSFLAHVATVCYGFAAASGIYGATIATALKAGGVVILLAFGLFFLRMAWRRRHAA
ncbi:SCO family protein [Stakelama saccharophila]|uniref:Thioredoxin domain-containing protein n=1 Tax=Stakelama saccharophila TaxID=3075605 RepID=A0ABZ0B6U7_9SPHN|nr:hypothetical protein [Stakelama sp. W311]WNO52720.1 hypothetical protein RPR59_09610 [Stakelama sp. W311]